jgi:hypothetical protein
VARVVILSSQSIFAEGVAASLQQKLATESLFIVDAHQPDALEQVLAKRPTCVILEATDAEVAKCCPLTELLDALPSLAIIRLDPEQDRIQVVTSQQHRAIHMSDLVEVITGGGVGQTTGKEVNRNDAVR